MPNKSAAHSVGAGKCPVHRDLLLRFVAKLQKVPCGFDTFSNLSGWSSSELALLN